MSGSEGFKRFIIPIILLVALVTVSVFVIIGTTKKDEDESSASETAQDAGLLNPFEKIAVSFVGMEGSGKVVIEPTGEIPPNYYTVGGRDGKLKNGDIVTITFEYKEFNKYYPNYEVNLFTYQYTVSGLGEINQNPSLTNQNTIQSLPDESTAQLVPISEASSPVDENNSRVVPEWLWTDVSNRDFILPDADSVYYSAEVFARFTDDQLRYARNEICAHAGREYKSGEYALYFNGFYWYNPYYGGEYFDNNCDSIINKYEKHNLDLINAEEMARKKK